MFSVNIKTGAQGLTDEMRRRLNPLGIRRVGNFAANSFAEGARKSAIRQMQRDIPWALQYQFLLQTTNARLGSVRLFINPSQNRRVAALLSLEISGGTVIMPNKDIRHWVRRVDRRFSFRRIFQLMKHAHAGALESASNSEQRKVYTSEAVDDKHYSIVVHDSGIGLWERYGRPYKTVFAPSTGRVRGRRKSRLIAWLPYHQEFKPRWKFQQAVDRHIRRNFQKTYDQAFARALRNRNYRAAQR